MRNRPPLFSLLLLFVGTAGFARGADATQIRLDNGSKTTVQPFLETYCFTCHGKEKTEAELDLTAYSSMTALVKDGGRWRLMLERLEEEEDMSPWKAKRHPSAAVRKQAVDWLHAVRGDEIKRHAGDPGIPLAGGCPRSGAMPNTS